MADLIQAVVGAALQFALDRGKAAVADASAFAARLGVDPAKVAAGAAHLAQARSHLDAAAAAVGAGNVQTGAGELAQAITETELAFGAVAWDGPPLKTFEGLLRDIAQSAGGPASALAKQLQLTGSTQIAYAAGAITATRSTPSSVKLGNDPIAAHLQGVDLSARLVVSGPGPALAVTLTIADVSIGLTGDGLAKALLGGSAGVRTRVVVTASSEPALHVGGGTAASVQLPAVTSGGPLQVKGLQLAAPPPGLPNAGGIDLGATVAVDASGSTFLIAGAGLRIAFDGNGLALTARPPDGVGISVDAGPVKGGGYLAHRTTAQGDSYEGSLDLRLGTIEVKAFGILDVGPPFALIIVMTAEFAPAIELGLGFTLNGVGGLVGIQHTVDVDAISAALSAHTLDSLLFPSDPVSSAPRILETLRSVFPVREGNAVFGPMMRVGWGRPSFVTADIGVMLSLPDPALVIIGRLRVRIPGEFLPIVSLTADVLGVITPEKLFIRASLTDSRIAGFTIGGDFGLLIRYSGEPEFALTAGGFHPSYTPPPELRGMARMSLDLSPPVVITLRAEAYAAITSATIQFGAKVEVGIDLAIASADGHLAFDALIRFLPEFGFVVDIDAGVSVHAFGFTLCSVHAHLSLSGTSPWRVIGTGSADFGWFGDVDIDFGPIEWGDKTKPPPVRINAAQAVADALGKAGAWAPILPAGGNGIVRLRAFPPGSELPLHPLGRLEARQNVLPFETEVTHLGSAVVDTSNGKERLTFGAPTLGAGVSPTFTSVDDRFAMGQFLDLSDADSLARPAFEQRIAGIQLSPGDFVNGTAVHEELTYETFVAGGTGDPPPILGLRLREVGFIYGTARNDVTLLQNALSRTQLRDPYADHATGPVDPIVVADPADVIVRSAETLAPAAGFGAALSFTDAMEAAAAAGLTDVAFARLGVGG